MNVEELKQLEANATPGPWDKETKAPPEHNYETDANLVLFLRNLAPELIALWEAVADQQSSPMGRRCQSTPICKAFDALDAKARSMVV